MVKMGCKAQWHTCILIAARYKYKNSSNESIVAAPIGKPANQFGDDKRVNKS